MDVTLLVILVLLIVVLLALVVLLVSLKAQRKEQSHDNVQLMMKSQEALTRAQAGEESMSHQFDSIVNQIQTLRKEQAASYQTMDAMQGHIETMNRVMTNTKARGNWGEYQLEMLLKTYAGSNPDIYTMQYKLDNGKIADAILHLPGTDKVLCIDAKFPMENYINEQTLMFRNNVKKHINDIAAKYINIQTVNQAILFLPSEAVYQYICSQESSVLDYALSKHVLLTSPSTLIGVIYTLLASTKDFYRATHMEEIEKNILMLQDDIERLVARCQKAENTLETLSGHLNQVSISANKVSGRVQRMTQGKEEPDDINN